MRGASKTIQQEKMIRTLVKRGAQSSVIPTRYASTNQSKLDTIMPVTVDFPARHIGPRKHDVRSMLKQLGFMNLDELTNAAVPDDIKLNRDMQLDTPISEFELIKRIQAIADKNKVWTIFFICSCL